MTDGCVQFNVNSWHYKVTKTVFPDYATDWDNKPRKTSLCPYMRHVVVAMLLVAFVVPWRKLPYRIQDYAWLVQAESIFLILVVSTAYAMDFADEYIGNDRIIPFNDLVMYGFLGGNLVGVVGGLLIFGAYSLSEYIKGRPKKDHKTRGLLKTYMSAKHDKICPCVEFVDDD